MSFKVGDKVIAATDMSVENPGDCLLKKGTPGTVVEVCENIFFKYTVDFDFEGADGYPVLEVEIEEA